MSAVSPIPMPPIRPTTTGSSTPIQVLQSELNGPTQKPIRLLTFNTWGLKYIAQFRKERLQAIADKLENEHNEYDVVALQEIWVQEDWEYIMAVCKKHFPYTRIFKSGIVTGPGLAVLSKIPIEGSFLYRFPINGRASAFFRGDWYVGKGISVTLLKPHVKGAQPIALLNSHMHAPYTTDNYSCHRVCQAWDIVKIVRLMKASGYATIVVGDLNSRPTSLPYRLFTVEGGMADSWDMLKKRRGLIMRLPAEIMQMNPVDQILKAGVTCDSTLNSWRSRRRVEEACRLDYAFVDPGCVTIIDAQVRFTERVPLPADCSYSDHFAYYVEFRVEGDTTYIPVARTITDRINLYKEIFMEIEDYQKTTIPKQMGWRKWHFFLGITFVVFLICALPFLTFISPLGAAAVLFINAIIGISAILNGMLWYFGVRSELRALSEVEMEVQDSFFELKSQM